MSFHVASNFHLASLPLRGCYVAGLVSHLLQPGTFSVLAGLSVSRWEREFCVSCTLSAIESLALSRRCIACSCFASRRCGRIGLLNPWIPVFAQRALL